MADEKTYTKAELDAAIAKAAADAVGEVDGLKAKVDELIGDNKKLKADLRKTAEIKPEDVAALEADNDKLRTDLAAATKLAKDATATADKATKALETEQGAARSYALEAEIGQAIAAGGIVPALVPAFTAMIKQNAKADLVDGKYAVSIGDKPAKDYITTFLGSEEGKAFKAAAINGGGGAPGNGGTQGGGKTVDRTTFDGMDQGARATFAKEGGTVVDTSA